MATTTSPSSAVQCRTQPTPGTSSGPRHRRPADQGRFPAPMSLRDSLADTSFTSAMVPRNMKATPTTCSIRTAAVRQSRLRARTEGFDGPESERHNGVALALARAGEGAASERLPETGGGAGQRLDHSRKKRPRETGPVAGKGSTGNRQCNMPIRNVVPQRPRTGKSGVPAPCGRCPSCRLDFSPPK